LTFLRRFVSWDRTPRALAAGLLAALLCSALGCGDPEPDPVPPAYEPPPASGESLQPEDVVTISAEAEDPADAIARLDRHSFGFELDAAALEWLEPQVPVEVQDYLRKRAQVDWEALRGGVDPEVGPAEGQR
jgi:hypothetical protein